MSRTIIAIFACLLVALGCWQLGFPARGAAQSVVPPPEAPPSVPQIPSVSPPGYSGPRVTEDPPAPHVQIPAKPPSAEVSPRPSSPAVKSSIWSLTIENVAGRTVVRASIGKKNELTIHCDHVDLQTQQGCLKALGKIVISAAGFQGSCDELTITLGDDTVMLNGAAAVGIWRQAQGFTVNHGEVAKVGLVELKAQQLSLRWPELLQVAPVVHTGAMPRPSANAAEPVLPGEQFRPATYIDSPLPPSSSRGVPARPRPLPHDTPPEAPEPR